ncbi:MAG: Ig-like domain-containing protein, partial [Corynebacterium pyruviciproducens]|uniref:Ig-like domain-containing protein n=1 Tax=Corynebacterium pyruviciproducens TaxID=598660 RepID=UPI003983ACEA
MTAIRNQRGGVRRGISIAAAALSLALVAPAIQPVGLGVVPQAEAREIVDATGRYVPANVGRVYDEGDGVRFAGLTPSYEFKNEDGSDFFIAAPHWLKLDKRTFLTGGSQSDPDASKAFLKFRDKDLYSQIDRIVVVGDNDEKLGELTKRDPEGSEWQLDFDKTNSFPGSAGTVYASNYKIFLNNGVDAKDLNAPKDGFAVDQYWVRKDGRIVAHTEASALLRTDGKTPETMPEKEFDGKRGAIAIASANNLVRPVSKFVHYNQGENTIYSTVVLPMQQNFLQASYQWAWDAVEQIDPKLAPYVESAVIYNSDINGQISSNDRSKYEVDVDSATGLVTTAKNPKLSWRTEVDADNPVQNGSRRFNEVRSSWNDIAWGTLGQSRPFTIQYKLKDGAMEAMQSPEGGRLDFASWINVDLPDGTDKGIPVDFLKNSYGYTYLDLTDTDGDGLTDTYESELGTDSSKYDTDGDGVPDGQEVLKDKTDAKKAGSYKPSTPDPEMTKIRTTDADFSVSVPKEIFKDKNDQNVPVTSDDTKLTVALVPESAVTTDPETGATKVDLDKAVGKTELPRTDVEKGDANITGITGIENGVKYKAVAITPNGEIAVSDKTIEGTDQPIEKTATPEVAPVTTNDEKITVTAEPGSEVKIELPDGTVLVPKEDANKPGTFTASIPKQKKDAQIKVTAQAPDKTKSDTQTVKVTEAAQPKTTVSGTPKTVNPTADKQDTGLKVANKD